MKYKILTILGTRPEIIRLSCVIRSLDENFDHRIVNTNQNYSDDLNKRFIKDLKIKKASYSMSNKKEKTPINFIANLLIFIDKILEKEKPDAIVILGDTNSSLSAICAKKKKIPIFHLEAGNRCFDQRVPEEINRKIVDHLSDINLPYSSYAEYNLLKEGINRDLVIKIGSPLFEVYNYYNKDIEKSKILDLLNIKKNNFILASIHREENVDNLNNLKNIFNSINKVAKNLNREVIFSTHPRTQQKLKKINGNFKHIKFNKPFGFFDYAKLLKNSFLTVSDSGSITEETSILNIRSVNIRNTHERQEGMEKGLCVLSGLREREILSAIDLVMNKDLNTLHEEHSDYTEKNVSHKVANIIQSYIPYINKKIWSKSEDINS
jgi:UDP-N-acetylglucosamine 2-epimerase